MAIGSLVGGGHRPCSSLEAPRRSRIIFQPPLPKRMARRSASCRARRMAGSSRRPPPAPGRWRLRGGGQPIPGLCRLSLVSPFIQRRRLAKLPPSPHSVAATCGWPSHPAIALPQHPTCTVCHRPPPQTAHTATAPPTATPTLNRKGAL